MDFSQLQMIYRAEGNANLVLALPQHKKILRLPKANISTTSANCSSSGSIRTDDDLTIDPKIASSGRADTITTTNSSATINNAGDGVNEDVLDPVDHVAYMELMIRFMGTEYTLVPEIVTISSTERMMLNRLCEPFRPAHRRDKEIGGQFGVLQPDATLLPDHLVSNFQLLPDSETVSFEIKPKQGWMLQDNVTSADDLFDLRDSPRCRYCAMQFSKLKSRKISKLSEYCPMDLFSGDTTRMSKALDAMFECPQNNLRIFRNGTFVYGTDHLESLSFEQLQSEILSGELSVARDVVINCLLKNYTNKPTSHGLNGAETTLLPGNCALWKILQLQFLAKNNIGHMSSLSKPTSKSYSFLRRLLAKENISDLSHLSPEEQYTLGATALDCSVIITFHEIENKSGSALNEHPNVVIVDKRAFLIKVTVIDLDAKPDSHFWKYVLSTNEAYRASE